MAKNNSNTQNPQYPKLTRRIEDNIAYIQNIFTNDETLVVRRLKNKYLENAAAAVIYIKGMTDVEVLNKSVIQPFLSHNLMINISAKNLLSELQQKVIPANNIESTADMSPIISAIILGDTVFLLDGYDSVLIINSKGWKSRGIEEPDSEKVVRGPREGFQESILTNLTLIRRKIPNPNLKFIFKEIGVQTKTKTCVCYLEGLVNQKILDELKKRLDSIDIDGILDSGYIQELIRDAPFSPFETIGSTERPDVAAGKLLEGRIVLIVDGSPFALTLPYLFQENIQINEDYYNYYFFSSFNRVLRIVGGLLSMTVPGLYIALVTHHQEMIPTPLLLSISSARQGISFPTIIEAIIMGFVFEVLREAGTRIPTPIGQTVSIVGALVLGQSAVDARIISAPMVIVTALTGITALLTFRLQSAHLVFRITFTFAAAIMGIFGVIFTFLGMIIHLMSLRSFGVPYMLNLVSFKTQEIKDTFIRVPWWYMQLRPPILAAKGMLRRQSQRKAGVK